MPFISISFPQCTKPEEKYIQKEVNESKTVIEDKTQDIVEEQKQPVIHSENEIDFYSASGFGSEANLRYDDGSKTQKNDLKTFQQIEKSIGVKQSQPSLKKTPQMFKKINFLEERKKSDYTKKRPPQITLSNYQFKNPRSKSDLRTIS